MTEREWLETSDHPWDMLDYLATRVAEHGWERRASNRKWRLFHCACCRHIWSRLNEASRRAVEVAERYADGRASRHDLQVAHTEAHAVIRSRQYDLDPAILAQRPALYCLYQEETDDTFGLALDAVNDIGRLDDAENAMHCTLLRELFGNPFRPLRFDPTWLACQDGTVVRLAEAAYDHRLLPAGALDPGLLDMLADALEEAGGSGELVEHLRGPGPHMRGCVAIDLLLGRS